MVDFELISQDKKKYTMKFLLKNTTPAFANALRRVIIDHVPTMAIEDVEFTKNSSVLYDSILAHRIGLTPLTTDLKSYYLPSECKCEGEGCARCTLQLSLSSKGPGIVTAGEMISKDPKVIPVNSNMPLTKILKGQEVEFIATAILGTGIEHVKWSPGVAFYKYLPVINIEKTCKDPKNCVDQCPLDILEVKGKSVSIKKDKLYDCTLCGACAEACPDCIKLDESGDNIIFELESFGQLSCKEILAKAFEILEKEFDDFGSKLK